MMKIKIGSKLALIIEKKVAKNRVIYNFNISIILIANILINLIPAVLF